VQIKAMIEATIKRNQREAYQLTVDEVGYGVPWWRVQCSLRELSKSITRGLKN
jgi:hypothetical protein